MPVRRQRLRAFTTVELLVVLAIVAMLGALLFPALLRVRRAALKTRSMSNMRQINLWMNLYSEDNFGIVLPSTFDYRGSPYRGLVRSIPEYQAGLSLSMGEEHVGTWTDILWTENELGLTSEFAAAQTAAGAGAGYSYIYDSPDTFLYQTFDGDFSNILRSSASNADNAPTQTPELEHLPRPFGDGAQEMGYAGYFAANDIFNTDGASPAPIPICYLNKGQIRVPDRMMYLIDSKAGEIIQPISAPFQVKSDCDAPDPYGAPVAEVIDSEAITSEVDFRYSNTCLIMLMDGHLESLGPFANLDDLQNNHRINVTNPFQSRP